MQKVLYIALLLFGAVSLQAQSILSSYDSLAVAKPKSGKDMYQMDHPLKQLEITCEKPEAVSLIPRKSGFFESALTLLTGIGTSSSTESSWLLPGKINCANPSDSWEILLFAEGEYVKNRERVRNDDGSVSIDSEKGLVIQWNKNAYGLVRQNTDTLVVFQVSLDLSSDTMAIKWLNVLKAYGSSVANKLRKYDPYPSGGDFYLKGIFKKTPFLLIAEARSYQSLLVMDGEPTLIFQQNTPFIILSKKDKVKPYLLYRKGLQPPEGANFIKLAFLSVMLRSYQSQEMLKM